MTKATVIHRPITIITDRFREKILRKSSELVALMNLLMAVSDIVLMVTQIRNGMDMPHTKQPLSPNRQLPVISVTPTNTALVQQLRMSLIARAMIYTGVSLRKTGLR